MKRIISSGLNCCLLIFFSSILTHPCSGQAEVAPWGNITGIRIDGQLMKIESRIGIGKDNWSKIIATAREHQRPKYLREGSKQIVTTKIDSLTFKEVVEDIQPGSISVDIRLSSGGSEEMDGAFFILPLSSADYTTINAKSTNNAETKNTIAKLQNDVRYQANTIEFRSPHRSLTLTFTQPTPVIIKKNTGKGNSFSVYIPLLEGNAYADTTSEKSFTITARGEIDKRPVTFKLNASQEGRPFDGFGGNFRLQNPKADPQVIDYCLKNLRVAWGRVEFPWRFWQPGMDEDPISEARDGKLNPRVRQAMEMAAKLQRMNIPIILSAWFPPQWAVTGSLNMQPVNGVWGTPLDSTKTDKIYKSITDYILYLKNNYNVGVSFFSFNESDLGINVRQTGEEHDQLIKGLGKYFKSRGLMTKMLLGDNSDATTYHFIYTAMSDPEATPYIGAVSFHSWRGWDKATLQKWDSAASALHLPLIVAEGSIDAAAWNYPAIFEEQSYALQEINLYVRLLAICRPLTILQWQLTSDYSPLAGGGIFGNSEPLHPTQRFWNFKQLASTPKGLFAMPIKEDMPDITCAALGDNKKGLYTIHIINNGAGRNATLTGLPSTIKILQIYTTDKDRAVKRETPIKVRNGNAKFHLDPAAFTTLMTE